MKRVFLAWIVILSVIAFVVYANIQRAEKTPGIQVNDLRLKLAGQEAVGLKFIQRTLSTKPAPEALDPVLQALDRVASTPEDRFHATIIVGEMKGSTAGLERLDALASEEIPSELADDIATVRTIYHDGPGALDPKDRDTLVNRHGFFGTVAESYGSDPQSEPRKSLERSAARALVIFGFLGLSLVALGVLSLGLFITGFVLYQKGRIQRAYQPDPTTNSAFLEGFALYLVVFVLLGLLGRALHVTSLSWNWLALSIIPLVAYWTTRNGIPLDASRIAAGWHEGRGWIREIAAGIGGYLAGLVVVIIGVFITALLARWTGASPQHPITQMLQGDGWHIVALYGIACVFAPVLEETMFRGVLFHYLRSRYRWLLSAPIVAALFAIVHPQGWVALPVLGAIALVLAALREWRGSILAPMAAHALNNFVALTVALLVLRS